MENKNLNEQKTLNKKESIIEQEQISSSINETNFNKSLTNEQKLEYLSKLIQNAEQNINKKLVKKNNSSN